MKISTFLKNYADEGKFIADSLNQKNSKWVLSGVYDGKPIKIEDKGRDRLDEILVEFGGKNLETVATDNRFLRLDGSWGEDHITELGHTLISIQTEGGRTLKKDDFKIDIPEGFGAVRLGKFRQRYNDLMSLYWDSTSPVSLLDWYKWVLKQKITVPIDSNVLHTIKLNGMNFIVKTMVTESFDTGHVCTWKNESAKNGTSERRLELIKIDDKHYHKLTRKHIHRAAGYMALAGCTLKKKETKTVDVFHCAFTEAGA